MKKFLVVAGALVALAAPSAALATQPENPGGFGQDRAAGVAALREMGLNWGHTYADGASVRKGDNAAQNSAWKVANGELPVESSQMTP
jgi:hypothetical protein